MPSPAIIEVRANEWKYRDKNDPAKPADTRKILKLETLASLA